MQPRFSVGQKVVFYNQEVVIAQIDKCADGTPKYYCQYALPGLGIWLPENEIQTGEVKGPPTVVFTRRMPHLCVIDNFYKDPDAIRALALEQHFESDLRFYKGKRTTDRFLWPFLKEEFERILGRPIVDWLDQPANGVFQITGYDDPLVYHSDAQSYAAAVYLTPHAPVSAGTSFWQDKKHHARRPPDHPLEYDRYPNDEARMAVNNEVYTAYNITHPDNWELVDKVGAVYNRLAIWDAQLIHSASTYEGLPSNLPDKSRLVQLFFFGVK